MDYIYAKLNYEVKESPDYIIAENEIIASENLHEYRLLKDGVATGDTIIVPKPVLGETSTTSYPGDKGKETADAVVVLTEQTNINTQDISDIKSGVVVAKKAEQDKNGNDIVNTYETLSNKAIDFSTVNNTKYPTTKAVDDTYATKTALALKANIAQEAWITPTLVNGWNHFGSPTYNASYMKDSMGFVHLRGRVKDGTISSYFMVLPVGYRPTNTQSYVVDSNGSFGRLVVSSDGAVNCVVGSNVFVSIDGITFKAEA